MVGFAKLFAAHITRVLIFVRGVAQPHVFVQVLLAVEMGVALGAETFEL